MVSHTHESTDNTPVDTVKLNIFMLVWQGLAGVELA